MLIEAFLSVLLIGAVGGAGTLLIMGLWYLFKGLKKRGPALVKSAPQSAPLFKYWVYEYSSASGSAINKYSTFATSLHGAKRMATNRRLRDETMLQISDADHNLLARNTARQPWRNYNG